VKVAWCRGRWEAAGRAGAWRGGRPVAPRVGKEPRDRGPASFLWAPRCGRAVPPGDWFGLGRVCCSRQGDLPRQLVGEQRVLPVPGGVLVSWWVCHWFWDWYPCSCVVSVSEGLRFIGKTRSTFPAGHLTPVVTYTFKGSCTFLLPSVIFSFAPVVF